ncbi:hypothetical protein ACFVT9_36410 [Kitasatospora cineracea]|uniref:hypothetical protein n=1 Tax=Kitasatospora cineracea TaxID=88074 RepID=UPI0036DD3AC6
MKFGHITPLRRVQTAGTRHTRKQLAIAAVLAFAAGIAALAWALTPATGPHAKALTIDNASGRPTACFAGDPDSYRSSPSAADAWTALQRAGTARGANVQQLIVPTADQTQADSFLASLRSRHCSLIIVIGDRFSTAAESAANKSPEINFIALDRQKPPSAGKNFKADSAADFPKHAESEIATLNGIREK